MMEQFSELGALKAGDEEAWTRAFHRLWPLAFHAARHPDCNLTIEEAEDAASEALGQLVSQIENVKALEEIKPLIVTIAYPAVSEFVTSKQGINTLQGRGRGNGAGSP